MSKVVIKINSPMTAILVIFGIGALLANYGVLEGAAYLFCLFAGISIYRMFTSQR